MLFTLFLCFLICSSLCVEPEVNSHDRLVVKLDPDQVVDAFKSVVSSDYLRNLAHDLATRAAEQFLMEMRNKQRSESDPISAKPRIVARLKASKLPPAPPNAAASMKEEVLQEIERLEKKTPSQGKILPSDLNTSIIDVKQAITLLTDPSPDGDNLDLISPNLSEDEETKEKKKGTPVVQLLKVNGKYYRRLLGFV